MRSAHWVDPFWVATTLPVKTTRPSFWMFSSWSESTVTGPFLPSAGPSGRGTGAVVVGRGGRERGDDEPSHQERPAGSTSTGTALPRLNVARTRPLMLLTSSATFDSKPVPRTTAPARYITTG